MRNEHYQAMKQRFEELGVEFNEEEFWEWYDGSKYAAKIICERLRKSQESIRES